MVVRPVVCRSFIGRRQELAYLTERRAEAAKSHGGLVLVAGDAGIGKSRLLAEFCAPLAKSRWRVGHGACLEHAQRPYGPLLDVLAAYDDDRTARALTPAATKREQLDAIVDRFARAAAKTGLVAVVEDIHWADTATLELLAFLAPKLERLRVLLLASLRPAELAPDHPAHAGLAKLERAARAGRIDLAPLDEPDLRRFIDETLTGFSLPGETRRTIARTCEGNPFFAEELLKVAVERTSARASGASGSGALPSSIRATLLERWRPLAEAERRIIAQAAVIGRTFELPLLARTLATAVDDVLPALQHAREVQLVEEVTATTFRFRHALTREAIYAGFLGAQVRPLHRTIALALESEPEDRRSLEGLAYHWWAAGDGERAARYNELAGDAAGRVHAHEDAIAFYERALEAPALAASARAGIAEKIADRCLTLGLTDRAHAAYGVAADLFAGTGNDEQEARCRVRVAHTAYALGLSAPTAPLEAMLKRLAPASYLARARVHLGIAWLAATFWYPTQAAHHLARIDARALAGGEDVALRYHNVAAWVAMTMGDLAAFRREHDAWIDAARKAARVGLLAAAHYNGAACYSLFGLHEEALAHVERALEIAHGERNRHGVEGTHAISAMCFLMSGDLARARAALEAVSPATDNHVTIADAVAAGTLAGAHLDDRALMGTWFDAARGGLLESPESTCGAGLAEVLVRHGRPAEASALLHRAIPAGERARGHVLTLLATVRYGTPEDAARARRQLVVAADAPAELLERYALPLFDAYAARRAGRPGDAAKHARAAADGLRRLRFPLLEAAARELAGELEAALAIYRRCGAVYDERRLRGATGASTTGALPETNGPVTAAPTLSPREREIAVLVARGNSNVEIARALAISHKTVEKHLGSVYQKLGFSSRTQLAAHVGSEGA
jgi:DNA-binding CsgD family transcriptional regulator